MIDKFILIIFGIEYLGFGLLGLIDPLSAASLVGFSLNELISLSEIRANYSFFCFIGLLSFVSLFKRNLISLTYLIYIFMCGSYLFGRVISIFVDGVPSNILWIVILAELLVFLIALWRYRKTRGLLT
tara:strand:+ start:3634 stop:4017 length:384 start_codon:yes stop_codon:yes gene_type:complete